MGGESDEGLLAQREPCIRAPTNSRRKDQKKKVRIFHTGSRDEERGALLPDQDCPSSSSSYNTLQNASSFSEHSQTRLDEKYDPFATSRSGRELWSFLRHRVRSLALHDRECDNSIHGEKSEYHKFYYIREAIKIKLWECLLAIVCYLVVGVIGYSFIFEHWAIVDSLYFSVVTFTTVGPGELCPHGQGGRLFTCVFALGGICFLGIALGVIGNNLVAAEVAAVERARGSNRMKIMSYFERIPSSVSLSSYSTSSEQSDGSVHTDAPRTKLQGIKEWWVAKMDCFIKFAPIVLVIFLCACVMAWFEGWNVIDALYYCVITATTVGYGDINPDTDAMRWYALVFIPIAVGVMGVMLSRVAELVMDKRKKKVLDQIMGHDITLEDLELMDSRGDGNVSRSDYVEFMLVAMSMVEPGLLEKLYDQFDRLDVDKNGYLARRDLEILARQRMKQLRHKLRLASYKYELTSSSNGSKGTTTR